MHKSLSCPHPQGLVRFGMFDACGSLPMDPATFGFGSEMHPISALERLGGAGTRRAILALTTEADLQRLCASGDVVRDARGRYALPGAEESVRAANALTGVVSHTSAARFWGWELKKVPDLPHVTVPRNRRLVRQGLVVPHWNDLSDSDIRSPGVTSVERTVKDCLASLPFDEALAVADSALRHGAMTPATMIRLARELAGPGSARARRAAGAADRRSDNPFESVLRAQALDAGLAVVPQVRITAPGFFARPDLVDVERRIVLEADSHTWHSSRSALRHDCRRYNELVLLGWTVLRFTWEDVMFHPEVVRRDLVSLLKHAQRPTGRRKRL